MGKFTLTFAEDDVKPYQKTQAPQIRFVTAEELPRKTDGLFQKSLCYASYYIMTFSAFCVFSPGHVAHAANAITSSIPL